MIGGLYVLNVMIWVCGVVLDYDVWEVVGVMGWGWVDVELIYDVIENDLLFVIDDYVFLFI